jgi:hypothetical protein
MLNEMQVEARFIENDYLCAERTIIITRGRFRFWFKCNEEDVAFVLYALRGASYRTLCKVRKHFAKA